jgi:hypothetical protein
LGACAPSAPPLATGLYHHHQYQYLVGQIGNQLYLYFAVFVLPTLNKDYYYYYYFNHHQYHHHSIAIISII